MIKVGSDSGNLPLGQVQEKQNNLFEKLASGKKVNNALDDASAQQIIDRLTSEVEGSRQAINNVYDGISVAQVAEGGLGSINDDVNRIRELTLQSGSGVLSSGDRRAEHIKKRAERRAEHIKKHDERRAEHTKKRVQHRLVRSERRKARIVVHDARLKKH